MRFVVSNNQLSRVKNRAKIHISTQNNLQPICTKPTAKFVPWQQDICGPATCKKCLRICTANKP